MNEGMSDNVMVEFNRPNSPQRRRSARLSSPPPANANAKSDNKMALASIAVKRSITVRKIAPRKTVAPSEHNKENTPRTPERDQQKKQKVSTPGPVPGRGDRTSRAKKKAAMPSPIVPSTPPPHPCPQQPAVEAEDAVWSQKVRRSYSRLSDTSLNSRETLFGFENLKTPEVVARVRSKAGLEVSGSMSGLNSFTSLLEADDCGAALPEQDTNIPGVVVVKEKRRRKKVQQIDDTEMDAMAAKMNAEFQEAEAFELVME